MVTNFSRANAEERAINFWENEPRAIGILRDLHSFEREMRKVAAGSLHYNFLSRLHTALANDYKDLTGRNYPRAEDSARRGSSAAGGV